jgi:hypothetical protein
MGLSEQELEPHYLHYMQPQHGKMMGLWLRPLSLGLQDGRDHGRQLATLWHV